MTDFYGKKTNITSCDDLFGTVLGDTCYQYHVNVKNVRFFRKKDKFLR